MIPNRSAINLQEKKVAEVYERTQQTPLHFMIDRQDSGHNNSSKEIVALKVDGIADHGQKEVNLKTLKVQPWEPDLFFTLKMSERSINYLAQMIPVLITDRPYRQKTNYLRCRE